MLCSAIGDPLGSVRHLTVSDYLRRAVKFQIVVAMRCLEFYSGLGGKTKIAMFKVNFLSTLLQVGDVTGTDYAVTGMHYALLNSFPEAEVVSAFDINPIANDVYQHNHCRRPYQVCQVWYITLLRVLTLCTVGQYALLHGKAT